MGFVVPQVITEDRASGAQVVDGSLKFDSSKSQYLNRTPGSAGNRTTWTWSAWIKTNNATGDQGLFGNTTSDITFIRFKSGQLDFVVNGSTHRRTNAYYRDPATFYHFVWAVDSTISSPAANRSRFYVNGVEVDSWGTNNALTENGNLGINSANAHIIGSTDLVPNDVFNGSMQNVHFIDGQQLGPEYFGYTDALTGTWRPKKYTGNFGGDLILAAAPYSSTSKFNTYNTYGTVVENATGYTLPMSNPAHYGGKAKNLTTGGFRVDTTNSAAEDFFFGCWVKFDVAPTSSQIGINLSGSYVYFEVRTSGVIRIRHTGGVSSDSSATNVSDGSWHHIALSRSGNTLYGFVDGTAVVSTTSGVTGNSVGANSQFWFFGGDGTSYNVDGQIIDPFVYIGQGVSSYTTPTSPLINGSGNINHFSTFSDTEAFYISPGVDVSGSDPNTVSDYYPNGFYLPFDGSAPIGQDQSGRGNNWTPVNFNFGGSASLDKATGALPILNTFGSNGKTTLPSVRDDSAVGAAATCVLALPLVGSANDVSNQINSGSTTKTVTVTNAVASSAQSNFYGGSWYFDGTGDWVNVSGESDFAFGTGDFTIECWAYTTTHTSSSRIISQDYDNNGSGNGTFLFYRSGSTMQFYSSNNGSSWDNVSGLTIGVIPVNTWTHLAVTRLNGTVYTWLNGIQQNSVSGNGNITNTGNVRIGCYGAGTGEFWNGYIQDLRIYNGVAKYTSNFIPASTDPDILPDTPSGVSGGSKLTKVTDGAVAFDGTGDYLTIADDADFEFDGDFTLECFVYLTSNSGAQVFFSKGNGGSYSPFVLYTPSESTILQFLASTSGSSWALDLNGSASYPLPLMKWTHLAAARSGSSVKIFVDGNESASGTLSGTLYNNTTSVSVGAHPDGGNLVNGFISNARIIKGTALYTSSFTPPTTELTNVTNTVLLCCKSNTSATAFDVSPGTITANGDAAATNFNPFTTDINAVRGQETGYATLSPLSSNTSYVTLSNGNLNYSYDSAGPDNEWTSSTILLPSSGKYYAEITLITVGSYCGVSLVTQGGEQQKYAASSTDIIFSSSNYSPGDVGGILMDIDVGTFSLYRNNVLYQTNTGVNYNKTTLGLFGANGGSRSWSCSMNFGQNPFKFPPPEGFLPLNAANVRPSTVIARPDQYVGIVTYTGNGTTQTISGLEFSPDFIWIKSRTTSGYNHALQNTNSGIQYLMRSNLTNGEVFQESNGYVSATTSNGFTVVPGDQGAQTVNASSNNYVAWCWKAGGNSNTFNIDDVGYATASAAGLTAGALTPSGASINTKSGFSIIKATKSSGIQTISHGLTQAPTFIIAKNTTNTSNWPVWHTSLGAGNGMILDDTLSSYANDYLASTLPTSSVFYVNSFGSTSSHTYIYYLWHDVPGLQKFGSYTGNGLADGPVVITGFRPRWILTKRTNTTGSWILHDTERDKYNPTQIQLYPNLANKEDIFSPNARDVLSNGFKLRGDDAFTNASGSTYIYAAFAEAPTFNLYGAQSNAR
jgi:hypothetical protein